MIRPNKQNGFTLVELMIATTVFSVVMLLSTYAFIQINRYYAKGISLARTQDAARNIVSDISNQLQFTAAKIDPETPPPGDGSVCVGNKKYDYKINVPESDASHALTITDVGSGCTGIRPPKVVLAKDTRVLEFRVSNAGSVGDKEMFIINISLMHLPDSDSDKDLIENYDPTNTADWLCKTGVPGGEYCSLSRINTTVYRRL